MTKSPFSRGWVILIRMRVQATQRVTFVLRRDCNSESGRSQASLRAHLEVLAHLGLSKGLWVLETCYLVCLTQCPRTNSFLPNTTSKEKRNVTAVGRSLVWAELCLFLNFMYLFINVCVCACARAHIHVRSRVQGQLWSWLSPSTMGSGNQTQVFSLQSKCLYQLSKKRITQLLLWDWFFILYPISRDLFILGLSTEFSVSASFREMYKPPL